MLYVLPSHPASGAKNDHKAFAAPRTNVLDCPRLSRDHWKDGISSKFLGCPGLISEASEDALQFRLLNHTRCLARWDPKVLALTFLTKALGDRFHAQTEYIDDIGRCFGIFHVSEVTHRSFVGFADYACFLTCRSLGTLVRLFGFEIALWNDASLRPTSSHKQNERFTVDACAKTDRAALIHALSLKKV